MRLFAIGTILSIGIGVEALHYPESVPLHRRQDPGTPEYDCHANCGGVIVASRSDGYCSSDTFKSELKDCLGCALKYNIWQYYGDSVSKAATACGLEANPVESTSAGTTPATSQTTSANQAASGGSSVISPTTAVATASSTALSSSQSAPSPYSTAMSNLTSTGALPSATLFQGGTSSYSVSWSVLNVIAGVLVAAMF